MESSLILYSSGQNCSIDLNVFMSHLVLYNEIMQKVIRMSAATVYASHTRPYQSCYYSQRMLVSELNPDSRIEESRMQKVITFPEGSATQPRRYNQGEAHFSTFHNSLNFVVYDIVMLLSNCRKR